ncbi:MAG TPA: molybdopterin molybdotransferase MoeA [Streptomyces sp.]|nr:molybdopterin molybdotransferase MoeA [Streptomyces sp.]
MSGDELADALALADGRRGSGEDGRREGRTDSGRTPRTRGHSWPEARATAARAGAQWRPEPVTLPLDRALGHRLAAPLTALTDLPPFDTSAMDGWAVSGPGPWELPAPPADTGPTGPGPADVRESPHGVLAGHGASPPLPDGHAVRIATGARIPPGTTAVLRSEYGEVLGRRLRTPRPPQPGADIRLRGQECRDGDELLPGGTRISPAVLGLAAAAGWDELSVVRPPRAEVLVLGDELLTSGRPEGGRVRDALGPMVGPWLTALGAEVTATRRLGDDADALCAALAATTADLVVTTGGTASGPVDHVHPALRRLGATLLVDGVAVRPGHPMLLARLPSGAHLVGLPGNPLAAVAGLLTLAEPLLRTPPRTTLPGAAERDGTAGPPAGPADTAPLLGEVHSHPHDTRLVPVVQEEKGVRPLSFAGPAMLRGIATATALAVVPPGGTGTAVRFLRLPWA